MSKLLKASEAISLFEAGSRVQTRKNEAHNWRFLDRAMEVRLCDEFRLEPELKPKLYGSMKEDADGRLSVRATDFSNPDEEHTIGVYSLTVRELMSMLATCLVKYNPGLISINGDIATVNYTIAMEER